MTPDDINPKWMAPLNSKELAFLCQYHELRGPGEVAGWAMNLAYELTKAESFGWRVSLIKGAYGEDGMFVPTQGINIPLAVTLPDDKGLQAKLVREDGSIVLDASIEPE